MGDGTTEARKNRLEALDQTVRISLLFGAVGRGRQALPVLHRRRREGVHDVMAFRSELGIQQRRHRDEDHALLILHPLPVLQQKVVAVGPRWDQISPHTQMQ